MLPSTVVGVLVILVAVLPGAVYTWAFERQASPFGVTFADRTLRFIGVSVVVHLLAAWPEYAVYRVAIAGRHVVLVGQFLLLWAGLLLLVALPGVAGTVLGGLYATRTTRKGWSGVRKHLSEEQEARLLSTMLGRDPAPRAWDQLFSERPDAYLRVRTVDGTWLAGRFANASYAGGFPNDADLLLEEAYAVDQSSGLIGGQPRGYSVYVPAAQIAWLEVVPQQE